MKVKMILPALTEATSPFWRPIKYSLFPPLGLATLAGYLDDERRRRDPGRARGEARPGRSPGPGRHPGLHHLGLARLSDRGSLPAPGCATWRSAASTSRHCRKRPPACGHDLSRTWRGYVAAISRRISGAAAGPRLSVRDSNARRPPADPARSHQAASLSRAELHRRVARVSACVRLLLQGGVLRRRAVLLHANRRCRARRDRAPAGTPSVLSRRSPVRGSSLRRRRCSTACAGWDVSGRPPAPSTRCSRQVFSSEPSMPAFAACSSDSKRSTAANLLEQRKYQNLRRDYGEAIRRLHDLGVMINGSFVFGMDGDDARCSNAPWNGRSSRALKPRRSTF